MEIVFHLGMHCTDADLLIRSILQNRARLAEDGICVPGPLRYRELIGKASTTLRGAAAPEMTEETLLVAIDDGRDTERIILSNDNFLCRSDAALGPDGLYPKIEKSAWLRKSVPSHEVSFALAIRNPATFLPDLLSGAAGRRPPQSVLEGGICLDDMRWVRVVEALANANPGCPILVWCHEDTPFIWSELLRELTGYDATQPLDGALDMAEAIMTPEGFKRLTDFKEARNIETESRWRRTLSSFLETYAEREKVETEIDLPGWTEETVDRLTELYEEDVAVIANLPGVTMITP